MPDPLFSNTPIGEALDDQRRRALADVAALLPDVLLAHHPGELEAEFLERYQIAPLILEWDVKTSDPREVEIEREGVDSRVVSTQAQPVKITGTEITLSIPFSGAPGLFHWRPSTQPKNLPRGRVRGKNLLLSYSFADSTLDVVKRELAWREAAVKDCASSINSDVNAFNAELPGVIRGAIRARLDKLKADAALVTGLGVPRSAPEGPRRQGPTSNRRGHIDATLAGPAKTRGQTQAKRSRAPGISDLSEPKDLTPHKQGRRGRPKGPYLLQTRAEIESAYRRVWDKVGRRPYWIEVAHELGVDARTLREARGIFSVDEQPISRLSE